MLIIICLWTKHIYLYLFLPLHPFSLAHTSFALKTPTGLRLFCAFLLLINDQRQTRKEEYKIAAREIRRERTIPRNKKRQREREEKKESSKRVVQ